MAYAAAVTRTTHRVGGRTYHVVTIVETGGTDDTHVASVGSLPFVGTVVEKDVILTAGDGTATTVDSRLGETSGGVQCWENGAAAATIHDDTSDPYTSSAGTLYLKSNANGSTGTTGNVTTRLTIAEGRLS